MTICRWHIHIVILRLPDSWSNWNLEMLIFEEKGKPEYPEKNLSEQGREPTTNLAHIWFDAGIWTRATVVGGECSHHCATLAPRSLALDFYMASFVFLYCTKKKEFCKVHNNQPRYLHTLSVGEINSFLSHVVHFHHLLFNKPLSNFQDSVIILRELFILWCVDILQSNSVKYTV